MADIKTLEKIKGLNNINAYLYNLNEGEKAVWCSSELQKFYKELKTREFGRYNNQIYNHPNINLYI